MVAGVRKAVIGVVGAAEVSSAGYATAREVGRCIARAGAVLVCGGRGGVMEGAALGCSETGGVALGIVPGGDPAEANPYVSIAVATGMGHARNVIIAHTARALIAVEGGYGTLSEMAIALELGRRVITLGPGPEIPGAIAAGDAAEAVRLALEDLS